MTAPTYTLITVTYGGIVSQVGGFTTLRTCQQARSIALYGMTIEEREERERAATEAFERGQREWNERNPPRMPRDEAERKYAEMCGMRLLPDGRVQDIPLFLRSDPSPSYDPSRGEAVVMTSGGWQKKYAGDVKIAKCVIEMPDQ